MLGQLADGGKSKNQKMYSAISRAMMDRKIGKDHWKTTGPILAGLVKIELAGKRARDFDEDDLVKLIIDRWGSDDFAGIRDPLASPPPTR